MCYFRRELWLEVNRICTFKISTFFNSNFASLFCLEVRFEELLRIYESNRLFSRVSSSNRLENGSFTCSNSILVSWFDGIVGFGDLLPGCGSFLFQIDHNDQNFFMIYRISFRSHDEILKRVWHLRLNHRQINPFLRL